MPANIYTGSSISYFNAKIKRKKVERLKFYTENARGVSKHIKRCISTLYNAAQNNASSPVNGITVTYVIQLLIVAPFLYYACHCLKDTTQKLNPYTLF